MSKSQNRADGQVTGKCILYEYAPIYTTLINNKANLTPTTRYCKQKKNVYQL